MSASRSLSSAVPPPAQGRALARCSLALAAVLCLALVPPVLLLPGDAAAQDKAADKKNKDKPGKKVEPLISQLPGIADEARCQAEIAVTAFKRLGALSVLPYMPSGLANAAAAGSSAAMSYCVQNPKACTDASDALMPRIGEMPTSCGG